MTPKSRKQRAYAEGLPQVILTIKKDKSKSKTPTTISHLLTKDNVREVIAELIKEQGEITDLICIFKTRNSDEPCCQSTSMEAERAIYLLDRTKFMYHEGQSAAENYEEEEIE